MDAREDVRPDLAAAERDAGRPGQDVQEAEEGQAAHQRDGFKLTPDTATDQEVPGLEPHRVRHRSVPGDLRRARRQLKTAMKEMTKLADRLIEEPRRAASAARAARCRASRARSPRRALTDLLVTPWAKMNAEPQMTAGIRLEELGGVLDNLASTALRRDREGGRAPRPGRVGYLSGKKMSDATLLGDRPGDGAHAVRLRSRARRRHSPTRSATPRSRSSRCIRSYLQSGTSRAAYAKTIAPMLAKTDFAAMFAQLPEAGYYRSYPAEWGALALWVSEVGDGPVRRRDPLRPAGRRDENPRNALGRRQWVEGIANNIDYLTEANFPDQSRRRAALRLRRPRQEDRRRRQEGQAAGRRSSSSGA